MIRSAARQCLSINRRGPASLGSSIGGASASSFQQHASAPNAHHSLTSTRCMSDGGGGRWTSWTKSIPGFGSKPIPPEAEDAGTTNNDASADAVAMDSSSEMTTGDVPVPSMDESMAKIYGSEPAAAEGGDAASEVALDAAARAAEQIAAFEPTNWPTDRILQLINFVNETAGFDNYATAIAFTTIAFRVVAFPLFVYGQKNSSRMGHIQPELNAIKDQVEGMGKRVDQATQMRVQQQTMALFKKYQCNPFGGLAAPLFTAPFFISMFIGLRKAPDLFPDVLANGGLYWFPDLTVADPYMIMPVMSAGTFLLMTEVGKEQMMASDPQKGRLMVNAFRALAVAMVPLTMNFNSAVFVYWTCNNTWSFFQALLLKQNGVKKAFGIWDPPKPVPGKEPKNIFNEVKSMFEQKKEEAPNALAADRIKAHNEIIEQQKMVREKLMEKEGLRTKGKRKSKGRR